MTTDATRASASALPEMSRRRMLAGAAIVPACGLAAIMPATTRVAAVHDPMLEAIKAYRAGVKAFYAIPRGTITLENEDELVAATYGSAQDRILVNAPNRLEITSLVGVREAIRFAFEEHALIDGAVENALRSALAYLDREAV